MAVWQEWAQEQSRDRRGLWGSGQGLEMGVLQGQGWEPPAGQGGRSSSAWLFSSLGVAWLLRTHTVAGIAPGAVWTSEVVGK